MEKLTFDVMLNGRYVCTLKYDYCPLFPVEASRLSDFVEGKRPSLKGKPFKIVFLTCGKTLKRKHLNTE